MSKPLTAGEKNRRANIRAMKAIGRQNAKLRAKTVAANVADHLARMEDRRIQALADKQARIDAGIAKRDIHNAMLARDAERRRVEALMMVDMQAAMDAIEQGAPMPILKPGARIGLVVANDANQMSLPFAA